MSDSVQFILGDVLEEKFDKPFDIIWSRDAFMHIPDKLKLFTRLFDLSAPGGRLVITDYARGRTPGSPEFEKYIETTGYHVIEPDAYGRLLKFVGFIDLVVDDATYPFIEILKSEISHLNQNRSAFLASFSEADLKYLVDRWEMKVGFCKNGDMKWGNFVAARRA
jgi:phosphoethanolamine N-methyltransferase